MQQNAEDYVDCSLSAFDAITAGNPVMVVSYADRRPPTARIRPYQ